MGRCLRLSRPVLREACDAMNCRRSTISLFWFQRNLLGPRVTARLPIRLVVQRSLSGGLGQQRPPLVARQSDCVKLAEGASTSQTSDSAELTSVGITSASWRSVVTHCVLVALVEKPRLSRVQGTLPTGAAVRQPQAAAVDAPGPATESRGGAWAGSKRKNQAVDARSAWPF